MSKQPARVAVMSPEPVVLAGLANFLERHPDRFELVAPPDGRDSADPDVVLYDVLALLEGEKDLADLLATCTAKVIAVARGLGPELSSRALGLGVDGVLGLGSDEVTLVDAVSSAATQWEHDDEGAVPYGEVSCDSPARRLAAEAGLAPRDADVLALVARGHVNEQIAHELNLTVTSVKARIRAAYRRIGVSNRHQATAWWIDNGLPVDPDERSRRS